MKFSMAERLILVKQFEILSVLNPGEARQYGELAEILRRGYEGLYGEVAGVVDESPMTAMECRQVVETLEMFRVLRASYQKLADTRGIDERSLRFGGFHPELEPRHFRLTRFLLERGQWAELKDDTPGYRSQSGRLDTYRPMLARFRWYWNPRNGDACLTRPELLDILAAGVAEPSVSGAQPPAFEPAPGA